VEIMDRGKSREILQNGLPLLLLVGLFMLAVATLMPFLPAILWGVILSVALAPLHARLRRRFGGRNLAATWAVAILLVLALVLPMIFLSRALIAFVPDAIAWVSDLGATAMLQDDAELVLPASWKIADIWAALLADIAVIRDHFGEELRPAAFWLLGEGQLVGTFVLEFALGVMLAAVLMHRAEAANSLVHRLLDQMGGSSATRMGGHAAAAIRSTVLGLLGSAAVQTLAATAAYLVVGLPHWPVLALATYVLALIQIGPVLIWGPAALWLWMTDQAGLAVFLAAWGILVVGVSDNVVRALVLSHGAQIPSLLAFLGAVGGLLTWGIVGIFVGSVIVGVAYQLVVQWVETKDEAGAQ
jgi:predicted PurR-regulated permease PerM